jgi:chloramphenicol-sensitive protein RarD
MKKGIISAAAAYLLWGVFPVYFKALQVVPATQILGHRIAWSFIFVMLILLVTRQFKAWRALLNRRVLLIYTLAAVLLAVNWLMYVWAVNSGFVVEASLGYFINPLVSVLLGVILLREKLRPLQWVPVGLAAAGVLYLTFTLGTPPWIALTLALSFGSYGVVKKMAPLDSLFGLSLETSILFIPALVFLVFNELQGTGSFGHAGSWVSSLLAFTGVISAIPLLLFATGLRSAPLSTIGLLQYITPTMQFLLGVLLFGEAFTPNRLVGFVLVWAALIFFTIESLLAQRKGLSGFPSESISTPE